MRYRIKEYTIGGDTDFSIAGKFDVEDIRLIINETQRKVICSSMNKGNIVCDYVEDMDVTFVSFSSTTCVLLPTDQLTIEVDKGYSLEAATKDIQDKIDSIPATDLTPVAKEQTLVDKAEEIVTEVQKVNDAQAMIDELLAIQLQTIIGGEE